MLSSTFVKRSLLLILSTSSSTTILLPDVPPVKIDVLSELVLAPEFLRVHSSLTLTGPTL
jgi:hypothetical protein